MKEQLKERATHGWRIAELLMLKALVMSSPEVRDLLTTSLSLKAICEQVVPEMADDLPRIDFETVCVHVDKAENLLIGMPGDTLPAGTVS